jgi:hypothetical protein
MSIGSSIPICRLYLAASAIGFLAGTTFTGSYGADFDLHQMPDRRFPPPWSVDDIGAAFVVKEGNGQQLAYIYYEDEPQRRSAIRRAADKAL